VTFLRVWSVSEQGPSAPHPTTFSRKLQQHLTCLREIWIIYKKKHFSRNFKNPKKFWKSEKNWNSRFQNFETIDLIILPYRSNRSNRKKSLNRLDRFIGQHINKTHKVFTSIRGGGFMFNYTKKFMNRFILHVHRARSTHGPWTGSKSVRICPKIE